MQLHDAVVIQVVVVIVTDEHKVDVRQLRIIQLDWRLHHSPASVTTSCILSAAGLQCCHQYAHAGPLLCYIVDSFDALVPLSACGEVCKLAEAILTIVQGGSGIKKSAGAVGRGHRQSYGGQPIPTLTLEQGNCVQFDAKESLTQAPSIALGCSAVKTQDQSGRSLPPSAPDRWHARSIRPAQLPLHACNTLIALARVDIAGRNSLIAIDILALFESLP